MNNYDSILANCVHAVDTFTTNPIFTEETVEDCIEMIRKHYDSILMSPDERPPFEAFYKTVASRFKRDEAPPVIKEHKVGGWLDRVERTTQMNRWNYYRRMLMADGKGEMLAYLDSDTFTILDCCLNPKEEGPWDRRGLAYGYVQSGKTANYIGLINKAFDVGYQIVILFTGMTEDLRQQTQDRVNEGVTGRDEQNQRYGVGELAGFPFGIIKGTTKESDLSKRHLPLHVANLSLNDNIVFVIKKNLNVLKSLIKWLKQKSDQQANGSYKITGTPFLVIDDEADNASINSLSKKEKESGEYDPKAINRSIRIVLSLMEQKSFVAYTATPYSVVLQRMEDNERTWHLDGVDYAIDENSDLFPQHFIVPIRHGDKYMGIERVFGTESEVGLPMVVKINKDSRFRDIVLPNGGFFTTGRGTAYSFKRLPDSLQNAILHFIAVIIVRRFREQDDHNTMLIHTSHEVAKIDHLAHRISKFLSKAQNAVLHDPEIAEQCNEQLERIRTNAADPRFRVYFGAEHTYQVPSAITPEQIHEVLEGIDLVSLHSSNDSGLKHKNHTLRYNRDKKCTYIIVGGNRLSRGLTIEGLSTSYFVRRSTRKDSLYQMGRWFGYRIGFEDCVQIYTDSDLYDWYRDVMMLEAKLRRDFDNMNSHDEMTPANWEIKVARSTTLDSLKKRMEITDPNKLRHTTERRLALGGQSLRTKYFKKDEAIQEANLKSALELVVELQEEEYDVDSTYPSDNTNLNFGNVPSSKIIALLNRFQFHSEQRKDFDDLKVFLENHGDELKSFSVALKRLKKSDDYKRYYDVDVSPIKRKGQMSEGADHFFIESLLDRDIDNTFDLIDDRNKTDYESSKDKPKYLHNLRNESKQALLIIYTIDSKEMGLKLEVFPALYFFIPTVGASENVLIRA